MFEKELDKFEYVFWEEEGKNHSRRIDQDIKRMLLGGTQTLKIEKEGFGKCILAGEHSVVYGGYCVCVPLKDLKLTASCILFDRNQKEYLNSCSRKNLFITQYDRNISKILFDMFRKTCNLLDVKIKEDILFKIKSDFPLGAGLGGSACISKVMIEIVAEYLNKNIDNETKFKLCNELEKINHHSPSGVDGYVVVNGKVVLFKKEDSFLNSTTDLDIDPSFSYQFVLIDSKERSSTMKMIEKVAPYFKDSSRDLVSKFNEPTLMVKEALVKKNIEKIKIGIDRLASLLKSIGLYTSRMEDIEARLKDIGVLSVKPTGACGGGMMLALVDPKREDQIGKIKEVFGKDRVFKFLL